MRKSFWIIIVILLILILDSLRVVLKKKEQLSETRTPTKLVTQHLKPTDIPDKIIKVLLVGDIMVGRSVNMRSLDKNDPTYPFLKVADKMKNEDIVFANLESPIVGKCPRIEHGFTFCADPKMIGGLTFSGVDIVTIANNHSHNFGDKGFGETKKYLSEKGIKWVGDGNLEIIEKNGTKFGFLGFDYVADGPTLKDLELIKKSDPKVDVLIVAPHWGYEYNSKANKNQRAWAEKIIEAGADVISGSHPHWVEDVEYFETPTKKSDKAGDLTIVKPVYYSLGNFVFDQMWSENTRKGLAVELTYKNGKIIKETRLETYIKEWAQPEWVNN